MKRLRRWLFNFVAMALLALFFLTVGFLIRSYFAEDDVAADRIIGTFDSPLYEKIQVSALRGAIVILGYNHWDDSPEIDNLRVRWRKDLGLGWKNMASSTTLPAANSPTQTPPVPEFELLGVRYWTASPSWGGEGVSSFRVEIPIPYLLVITGVIPALWMFPRIRSHVRRRAGLCPVCGYDLRATPDRCPECGMIPTAAKGAAT